MITRPHNRLSGPLCLTHSALFCWLAYCAVQSARNNAPWHCAVFVTASLITIVTFFREDRLDDALRREAARAELAARPAIGNNETAEAVVNVALAGACCETWWTSAGAEHDTVCRHRMPKGSAA
ncbi:MULTISPECIES: hypothetical protein [unclassified Streptomyces]|uniref:hypothetical protein n=1 Tax=unclassified Streptomyces TaxID=2593676 RepID=UPI0036EE5C47